MDWRLWIPNGPDWATNDALLKLGNTRQYWQGYNWEGMALTAVLASFFIVALGYMIGFAFNHAGIKKWVKSEAYQALASALLVVGLIMFVNLGLGAMSAVTADIAHASGGLQFMKWDAATGTYVTDPAGQDVNNPFVLSELFIDENLQCLKTWYLRIFLADTLVEPVSDFTVDIAGGTGGLSMSFLLGPIVSALYFASHNVVFLLIANYLQRHLLIFIYQTMFPVFLPLGIILRILPVTRGYGGFLIAVALGLYIVYPLSYSALMLTTRQMDIEQCRLSISAGEARGIQITDEASFTYFKSRSDRTLDTVYSDINILQKTMMFFVYRSFLFPLTALTLVFTFVRATASFFGADVGDMSRGLIKLI
jgi:hypothetical protein